MRGTLISFSLLSSIAFGAAKTETKPVAPAKARCEVQLRNSNKDVDVISTSKDIVIGAGDVQVSEEPKVSLRIVEEKNSSVMSVFATITRSVGNEDIYSATADKIVLIMNWFQRHGDSKEPSMKFTVRCERIVD